MTTLDVNAATFDAEVRQRSHHMPVVVDFWAAWCGPCRVIGPTLERLASEAEGRWILAKVDTAANPELAARYRIQSIPAVKAWVKGEVVDEFVGALPEGAIRQWLHRFVPDAADDRARAGDTAFATGDLAGARAAWQDALALRADHPGALLGLAESAPAEAQAWLARLPPKLDADLLARRARLAFRLEAARPIDCLAGIVDANPDDLDARWELAHALAGREDWEGALEHLLVLVRRNRRYRDDGARKAMLAIFDVVGVRSPMADTWRSALARVLY